MLLLKCWLIRNKECGAGHTILMSQTDEIHESFYDLFNQHFRSIEDPKHGTPFYANIATGTHSKPCHVDPKFQCGPRHEYLHVDMV